MTEGAVVAPTGALPVTPASLTADLRALGLAPGATVLVHTSLRALGWVCGGAQGVIEALVAAVGPEGTLVVPTQSGQLTDPAGWSRPPVPPAWWPVIRAETPAYRPDRTPTRGVGVVPETFRGMAGVRRSAHPHLSFAALGPRAEQLVDPHVPEAGLGPDSPLGRLAAGGAFTLLLGCGHESNTALHLAEYHAHPVGRRWTRHGGPVLVGGERRWIEWRDLDHDESDFPAIGAALEATGTDVLIGPVGRATARLMRIDALVGFATGWMRTHREDGTPPG
jgi:aminoglycoside 3-N-acetyltransferase